MREITDLSEIKKILEQILSNVADFCERNQMRYYLAFGTLLGAVRHDGFIPWDDDVDIIMPRSDYEKFISSFFSEKYKIIEVGTNKDYFYPFAKVYDTSTIMQENVMERTDFGLYIDIFPMDGLPDEYRFNKKLLMFLQRILKNKYSPMNRKRSGVKQFFLPLTKLLLKPIKIHNLALLINRLSSKYQYDQYDNVAMTVWGYHVYRKSDIEPGTKHRFENALYNVPGNYDEVLRRDYGDYMQFPPLEKRIPKHGYHAYYVDRD